MSLCYVALCDVMLYRGLCEKCNCSRVCFTNGLWAVQNKLAKMYNARNQIYGEFQICKLKLFTCGFKGHM